MLNTTQFTNRGNKWRNDEKPEYREKGSRGGETQI